MNRDVNAHLDSLNISPHGSVSFRFLARTLKHCTHDTHTHTHTRTVYKSFTTHTHAQHHRYHGTDGEERETRPESSEPIREQQFIHVVCCDDVTATWQGVSSCRTQETVYTPYNTVYTSSVAVYCINVIGRFCVLLTKSIVECEVEIVVVIATTISTSVSRG